MLALLQLRHDREQTEPAVAIAAADLVDREIRLEPGRQVVERQVGRGAGERQQAHGQDADHGEPDPRHAVRRPPPQERDGQRRHHQRQVLPERLGRRALDEVAEAAAARLVLRRDAAQVAVVGPAGQEQEEGDEQRRGPEHPHPAQAQDQCAAEPDLERQGDHGHDGRRQQEVQTLDLDLAHERLGIERLDRGAEHQDGAQKGAACPADHTP